MPAAGAQIFKIGRCTTKIVRAPALAVPTLKKKETFFLFLLFLFFFSSFLLLLLLLLPLSFSRTWLYTAGVRHVRIMAIGNPNLNQKEEEEEDVQVACVLIVGALRSSATVGPPGAPPCAATIMA